MDFSVSLDHWARTAPGQIAVASNSQELTYSQLAGRAQSLATALHRLPDERIGILSNDPVSMSIGFQASVIAGKTLSILDPAWPQELLHSMTAQLQVTHILTDVASQDSVTALTLTPLAIEYFEESSLEPWAPQAPGRDLLTICTSGSTGVPKVIVRTQGSWQSSLAVGSSILGSHAGTVTLCPGPISHGLGLYAMVESIHNGGSFIASGLYDATKTTALIRRYRCTRLVSVPTIIQKLIERLTGDELESLRVIVSGGEPLPQSLVDKIHESTPTCTITEYYGSSENSLIAFRFRQEVKPEKPIATWSLFPGVRIHFHDEDESSNFGTLYVDSPFNASGYDPQGKVQIKRCGHSISVNDRGRLNNDGALELQGRTDGMLNVNGNNVHPEEILRVMRQLGFADAHLRLTLQEKSSRLVVYTLQLVTDTQALAHTLFASLPKYKVPHELMVLSAWPSTNSGKILLDGEVPEESCIQKVILR